MKGKTKLISALTQINSGIKSPKKTESEMSSPISKSAIRITSLFYCVHSRFERFWKIKAIRDYCFEKWFYGVKCEIDPWERVFKG